MEKHHIKPGNVYNFDEKGFLAGIMRASKRIVPRWMLKNKRIAGSAQDGLRKFISLLVCICTDKTAWEGPITNNNNIDTELF